MHWGKTAEQNKMIIFKNNNYHPTPPPKKKNKNKQNMYIQKEEEKNQSKLKTPHQKLNMDPLMIIALSILTFL